MERMQQRPRISRAVKLYGTNEIVVRPRELQAGDLSVLFDNGGLRGLRYRGVEVLRGISYLVRDKDWGTYSAVLSNLKVRQTQTGFTVNYDAVCRDAVQEIRYDARIEGTAETLTFSATGTPTTDFLTNRTGFVVLHPLTGVAGAPVEIMHTDGEKEKSRFPKIISPGQPVFEIRSLKHTVTPGVSATVVMEANKFEMEDHRNWMDASYKTYVCSLLDPWPYVLPKGQLFRQTVTVHITGRPKARQRTSSSKTIDVTIGKTHGVIPRVGMAVPMLEGKAALAEQDHIKGLNLSSLVCQIDGREAGQTDAAAAFAALSRAVGVPVKLEIILPAKLPAHDELTVIAEAVRAGGLSPASVVVTQMHDLKSFQPGTPRPWGPSYHEMADAARRLFPKARIGGGMLSYFTELNRKPVPPGVFDFITHTVCPIVHAADDASVMETLEALPYIFESTRKMIGSTPYHLGPSGIPCRDNPYGASVAHNPDERRICLAPNDPRQKGLFAAAWTLGLAAAAARARLDEVALGAVTGPQGVLEENQLRPVYHAAAAIAVLSGQRLQQVTVASPGTVAALSAKTKNGGRTLLANLTAVHQTVRLHGLSGKTRAVVLDEKTFSAASRQRNILSGSGELLKPAGLLKLPPYAIAVLAVA
jgi:D-apionolactonase